MNIAKIAALVVLGVIAFTLGCAARYFIDAKPKREPVTLVRALKTNPAYDSIYVYSDGHMVTTKFNPPYRYFMVAYKYRGKNMEIEGEGNYSFSSPRIPSNETLDSMILSELPLKRNCYQGIIYQNFFEFKNGADWDDFYGNTPELKPVKTHTPCN